ncbi:MAG: DsrE family protein, partial [Candidatus Thorarchaeota archaeon SMTZ1-83]
MVNTRPYGKIINFEGWRAAVGMFGMDHEPTLLFMGDGVYSLLKAADVVPFRMFKATYLDFDGRILASKKSLESRGISPGEIFDDVEVADESAVSEALTE